MITYWDSSSLMLSLIDPALRRQLDPKTSFTRTHSLAEVFSALTGKHGPQRVNANDAARQLRELAAEVSFVDPSAEDVLQAFSSAQRRGIRGGQVHDYLHALAAKKAGAKRLITADKNDFEGLADELDVETV